jgi:hypothetical protein
LPAAVIASPIPDFEDFGIEIHFTPFHPLWTLLKHGEKLVGGMIVLSQDLEVISG